MTQTNVAVPFRRVLGPVLTATLLAVTLAACVTTSASPSPTPIPPGDGAPPTAPATVPGPPSIPPTAPVTPMPSASPVAMPSEPVATARPPAATPRPTATHPAIPASTPASTPAPTRRPKPTASALGTITGHALSGPTCPVARFPPDPKCADKPVVGAEIVVTDAAGREVARVRTSIDGAYVVSVPPGTYTVTPQPVQGILRTGGPQTVSVASGATVTVDLAYDTGIR